MFITNREATTMLIIKTNTTACSMVQWRKTTPTTKYAASKLLCSGQQPNALYVLVVVA